MGCRMRFSVKCAFPHLGKRRPTSRESAFCTGALTKNRILDSTPHAKAHSADHDAVEFSLKAAELMDSQWRLIYEKAESSAQYSPPSARLHARLALVCIDGGQRGRQRQTAVIGSAQGGSDLLVFRHENTHLSFRCMPLETPNQLVHEV